MQIKFIFFQINFCKSVCISGFKHIYILKNIQLLNMIEYLKHTNYAILKRREYEDIEYNINNKTVMNIIYFKDI